MIALKNIHVVFNKNTPLENHVLKGINLNVQAGEFITIIGGNGAGKSTLMNVLSGDLLPNRGEIIIDQKNVTKIATEKRSKWVSRVMQDPMIGTFANLTIEENLCIASKRGQSRGLSWGKSKALKKKIIDALTEIDIGLEHRLDTIVASLSGGQRQVLSLVMATLQDTKILLLDEHTAALDPKIAKRTIEITDKLVRQHALTTIMITHSMSQALAYGTRTLVLNQGLVVQDLKGIARSQLTPNCLVEYFYE